MRDEARLEDAPLAARHWSSKVVERCDHMQAVQPVTPSGEGCEECLAMGADWVHLRLCLTCGHVGCCDSSRYKHATKHFHRTKHPVVQSFEPGETWKWCYVDEVTIP
jgi:uncharacterized UBP type Zn finger protein